MGRKRDHIGLVTLVAYSLGFALVLSFLIVWLYTRSTSILEENLRDRLRTYALLSAMQFTAEEIDDIRTPDDMQTPSFVGLISRLRVIKEAIPDATYVYIMRRTENPMELEFVLEDDMLDSFEELDLNGDGVLEEDEVVVVPGERFDISDVPMMQGPAFEGAAADEKITRDQWGAWVSGYAPILDDDGNAVAILGVDMRASHFLASAHRIFSPVSVLAVLGLIFLSVGVYVIFVLQGRLRFVQEMDCKRRALVRSASHKLGGPLSSLRWWLELLDSNAAVEQMHEAKQQLQDATDRIAAVSSELEEAIKSDLISDKELNEKLAEETQESLKC